MVYTHTPEEIIRCGECRHLSVGDQVDIILRTDVIPSLPSSIRGVVLTVNSLDYLIEYESDDLLGVAPTLTPPIVASVDCVGLLQLAREYSDQRNQRDDSQDQRMDDIESSLAALGVFPSSGNGDVIVHPDSYSNASPESVRHYRNIVADGVSSITQISPTSNASPFALPSLTGIHYVLEIEATVISDKVQDYMNSHAKYVMTGRFNQGATTDVVFSRNRDGVTMTGVKVGNEFRVNVDNQSGETVTSIVTTKLRLFN